MELLDKLKDSPLANWIPEPKIIAAATTAVVASGIAWALGKKGYTIPKKSTEKFATALVALTGAAVSLAGYAKSGKSAEVTAEVTSG